MYNYLSWNHVVITTLKVIGYLSTFFLRYYKYNICHDNIFFKLEKSLKRTDISKECRRYSEDTAVAIISLGNNRLHGNALLHFKCFKTWFILNYLIYFQEGLIKHWVKKICTSKGPQGGMYWERKKNHQLNVMEYSCTHEKCSESKVSRVFIVW